MAVPSTIKVKPTIISLKKCQDNFKFWKGKVKPWDVEDEIYKLHIDHSKNVLAAHTAAYNYLKGIFGYDEKKKQFDPNAQGIIAQKFRLKGTVPDKHMSDSQKLGHDVFIFAYHGVHNPYHRKDDSPPILPFGFFVSKDIEEFAYSHGAPCDVTEKNDLVDQSKLDKYYLLAQDLREFKAHQVATDDSLKKDFWYYFGNPATWEDEEDYGLNLFKNAGEFRYYEKIRPSSIKALLWPFVIEYAPLGSDETSNENLDLYNAFKKAFPIYISTHEKQPCRT